MNFLPFDGRVGTADQDRILIRVRMRMDGPGRRFVRRQTLLQQFGDIFAARFIIFVN